MLAIFLAGGGAAGQEPDPGVVEAIRWEGLETLSEDSLAHYLGVEVGRPLDPEALNRGVHTLWASGLVDDVEVAPEPTPTGVVLRVRVRERPRLVAIEVEGLGAADRTAVHRLLESRGIARRGSRPLDRAALAALGEEIAGLVRQRGRRLARVDYRLEPAAPGEARAVFAVSEPAGFSLAAVDFEGNEAFSDARLRRALRARAGALTVWVGRPRYDLATLERELAAVRDLYREHGFKDAAVGPPLLRAAPAGAGETPRVVVPIREGRAWRLGELSVRGNRAFGDRRLLALFPAGDRGRLRASAVDAWREAIRDLYQSDGRLEIEVRTELRERENGAADLIAHVSEGGRFRLGRLEIEGNTRTREKVLRRALGAREGEVLDLVALRRGLARLEQARLFRPDPERPFELRRLDRERGTADLLVRGREADLLDFGLGGGWSEVYGLSGRASVGSPNLFGRGHSAGLTLSTGGYQRGVEASYAVPWLFDRPQSLRLELFDRRLDYSLGAGQALLRDERGARLGYRRALGPRQTLGLDYTRSSLDDRQSGGEGGEGRILTRSSSSLRAGWVRDSRNDPFDPGRGLRTAASLETAGGALGGDNRFYRAEAEATLYHPLRLGSYTSVLGVHAAGGRVEPRGAGPLSPLEAYYLGGGRGPRGFAARSLSARGDDGELLRDELGLLVGGTRFLTLGLEVRLPLGGPFSLALFTDAGDVRAEGRSFDLSGLRHTAGVELRLRLPRLGLPLRLVYARNLDPLPGDRFEELALSFGPSF